MKSVCTEQSFEADENWNTHFRVYTVRLRVRKNSFLFLLAKGQEKSGIVRKSQGMALFVTKCDEISV